MPGWGSALGLTAGFCWGSADFLGGRQTRKGSVWFFALVSQIVAAAGTALLVVAHGAASPSWFDSWPALLAGVTTPIGILCLWNGLAQGVMAEVAPIANLPLVPFVFGIIQGRQQVSVVQLGGSVAIMVGVCVVASATPSRADSAPNRALGLALAFAAMLAFGTAFTGLAVTSAHDPAWASFYARVVAAVIVAAIALPRVVTTSMRPRIAGAAVLTGLLQACAAASFAWASTLGNLSLVSVLNSSAPVFTALYARSIYKERLAPFAAIGVLLVLAGTALLVAG